MNLITEPYLKQRERWPAEGRHILAQFDNQTVVVYLKGGSLDADSQHNLLAFLLCPARASEPATARFHAA